MIIGIFQKLGVDQSIFYQFAIFIVLFAALKATFFNKLLFVIQTRESKTTKLNDEAGDKFKEAEKLSEKFDNEIQKASEEAHSKMSSIKNESLKKIMDEQKAQEAKVLAAYEEEKKAAISEVEAKREAVLQSANELSDSLVNKLVN
jgi:F0F1-type ATP synthase membrane subunit b/b'